ncbi:MAG: hypothetical protein IJI57_00875 [Flexilinea sp.]|nr:hypothetical protein [Flexilinea sp.]
MTNYKEKLELLQEQIIDEHIETVIGSSPGGKAGWVVFLSVCDGNTRASVFSGTGSSLENAWNAADKNTRSFVSEKNFELRWLKADVVRSVREITSEALTREVLKARHEFYRYGIAFNENFKLALLETELNGAKIYEYDNGGLDLDYLNRYLKKSGRIIQPISAFPEKYLLFETKSWLCDEDNAIYPLYEDGLEVGRRKIEPLDADHAMQLIDHATAFLVNQVKDDGSFIYGFYPRFDNEIENYNIVRHASTLWSLICRYRISPSEELAAIIEKTISYMITQIIHDENGNAYLYEAKDDEIKLGGCGVAVVALTEYMDVFGNKKYVDLCCELGNGILGMFDWETGEFWHILNGDFSRKEKMRTVYYDGEATFALSRLYALTGDEIWLNAGCRSVDHFIEAEYEQYKDHWVAYSLNEITKHVKDRPEYFAFALRNAEVNLENIAQRDTTYHTYLELLMSTFELYDRMIDQQIPAGDFDIRSLLNTIFIRAQRQLNGFFFPEYAMYMANPNRILNTFMVRHDGYRVRIDDVQHNIGGYYLYYKNYDKMLTYISE